MDVAYPHIAERLFGRPHAIAPEALRAIIEGKVGRRVLSGEPIDEAGATRAQAVRRKRMSSIVEAQPVEVAGGVGEFALTADGIAIVPVCGILGRRFDWLAAVCGWTTYEGLAATFDAMLADSRVRGILMDVESPGGEAAGMLDIADKIISSRAAKPIWAVANTYAASAAYAIAGCAERLFLPRLGQVGSIGAVIVHVDQSAYDEASGLSYSAVYSGARKIDGWGHAPLSDQARKSAQIDVDHCRAEFAALVERQGRMTAKDAVATEADVYSDNAAVNAHLADGVATFEDALIELSNLVADRPHSTAAFAAMTRGEMTMAKEAPTKLESQVGSDKSPAAANAAVAANAATDAASSAASAPAAATSASADGDICPECGRQIVPDAGESDPDARAARAGAAVEILDLCALAGAGVSEARAFIADGLSADAVRTKLAEAAANKADTAEIDPSHKPAASSASWDDVVAGVNKQFGVSPKK